MDLKSFISGLEKRLNIPENHHLVAVFENNESDKIIGWIVAEIGVEADYPVYTIEELFEKFKKQL
jgi:hypothetical protein